MRRSAIFPLFTLFRFLLSIRREAHSSFFFLTLLPPFLFALHFRSSATSSPHSSFIHFVCTVLVLDDTIDDGGADLSPALTSSSTFLQKHTHTHIHTHTHTHTHSQTYTNSLVAAMVVLDDAIEERGKDRVAGLVSRVQPDAAVLVVDAGLHGLVQREA